MVNVGQNTALGNGDVSQQLVQLLVVADGELEMTGNDTGLLVIAGSVTGKFENFSSEVLENGGKVDGGAGTDTLGIVALAKKTVNTADGECQTSLGRTTNIGELVVLDGCALQWAKTYDWAFLEPEALPPDLPPPVILFGLDERVLK